jgi:hypothetical protein
MASEQFLALSPSDKKEILRIASQASGRDENTIEKDVWVVWALSILFESELGAHLSFKGGTSLSKVYRAIDRFSEDIDLTYDIRSMIPEMAGGTNGLPTSRSQGQKWTEHVRAELPKWIASEVLPRFQSAIAAAGLAATLRQETKERLFIDYQPGLFGAHGYVKPQVMLEFGARSTGEPTEIRSITCDASEFVPNVIFPIAKPRTMKVERTFWEKATAAHVFCLQRQLKGERFARHWHDLAALANAGYLEPSLADRKLAEAVAKHKSIFFREKAADGTPVDYEAAVHGSLRLVPDSEAFAVLEADYLAMVGAGMLYSREKPFKEIMNACSEIETLSNATLR